MNNKGNEQIPANTTVSGSPVKSFFVSMLTRDISLEDAILDLLDNCVDGILRMGNKRKPSPEPYSGFKAEIQLNGDSFLISDNCGGIPWSAHEYAFRMGRPASRNDTNLGTVGVYGIGMKRAIFKMGKQCLITTKSGDHNYEVEISPDWMTDADTSWDIPVRKVDSHFPEDGTTIFIDDLYEGVSASFSKGNKVFISNLQDKISTHYAFIISKGFEIVLNGKRVVPKPTKLVFSDMIRKLAIRPFIYETRIDGVDVFVAVGITRPVPSQTEVESEQSERRYSAIDAGWTIVCNDRAVLYCDRTELTGWGEAGVPKYHNQFIAISGVVEFRSRYPDRLPTTTTKRGIDTSSVIYLQVKNRMREGMKIFTDFTNKWKEDPQESRELTKDAPLLTVEEIRTRSKDLKFTQTKKSDKGKVYKPKLPLPKKAPDTKVRISFSREISEVEEVSYFLFGDQDKDARVVGERVFDDALKKARK